MVDNIATHDNKNNSSVKPQTSKHNMTTIEVSGNLGPDQGQTEICPFLEYNTVRSPYLID